MVQRCITGEVIAHSVFCLSIWFVSENNSISISVQRLGEDKFLCPQRSYIDFCIYWCQNFEFLTNNRLCLFLFQNKQRLVLVKNSKLWRQYMQKSLLTQIFLVSKTLHRYFSDDFCNVSMIFSMWIVPKNDKEYNKRGKIFKYGKTSWGK